MFPEGEFGGWEDIILLTEMMKAFVNDGFEDGEKFPGNWWGMCDLYEVSEKRLWHKNPLRSTNTSKSSKCPVLSLEVSGIRNCGRNCKFWAEISKNR